MEVNRGNHNARDQCRQKCKFLFASPMTMKSNYDGQKNRYPRSSLTANQVGETNHETSASHENGGRIPDGFFPLKMQGPGNDRQGRRCLEGIYVTSAKRRIRQRKQQENGPELQRPVF